jgi:phage tail sheath protein FI
MLNAFLFELNSDRTRQRITANVDSFLSDLMAAGGIVGKNVVCDLSNNSADTINNSQLIVDVFVIPVTCIEFIRFNVIVTKQGASFSRV